MATDPVDIVISDPREIRALAHPARVTVLHHLYAGEVLTATECAALAGLSPSAMSYHLRSLERSGLIVRCDPTDDARERPWQARGRTLRVDPDHSAAARTARAHLLRRILDQLRIDLDRSDPPSALVAGTSAAPSTTGDPAHTGAAPVRGINVVPAHLTQARARALMDDLGALLARYALPEDAPSVDGTQADDEPRAYHLYWAVMPVGDAADAGPA